MRLYQGRNPRELRKVNAGIPLGGI